MASSRLRKRPYRPFLPEGDSLGKS